VLSTTNVVRADRTMMLERSRLSFLSVEVHTGHSQAIIGTPLLVPLPKKVIVSWGEFTSPKLKI
jgi:hypothetical protein